MPDTPASGQAMPDHQAMPAVGEAAPDFALPDDTGSVRQLTAARGRWLVLYFYPKDDTPGCTTESCQLRDEYATFKGAGAEVWGVSILDSASKAAFRDKYDLPFPLLADADHAVAERYGVWVAKKNYGRTYWGVQRATWLIDPDGIVAHVWPTVTPDGHAREVLAVLEGLRRSREGA